MKKLFFVVLLIIPSLLLAQDVIYEQKLNLKRVNKEYNEYGGANPLRFAKMKERYVAYPIVDAKTNKVTMVVQDQDYLRFISLSPRFETEKIQQVDNPKNKYKNLLGHSIHNNTQTLYFSNPGFGKFFSTSLNLASGQKGSEFLELDSAGRSYIQSFSFNNKFYILNYVKSKDPQSFPLELLCFKSAREFESTELNITLQELMDLGIEDPFKLFFYTENSTRISRGSNVNKLEDQYNNPLSLTTARIKLYYEEDKLYLTLDHNWDATLLITVDLDNYSSRIDSYLQKKTDKESTTQSNSFLTEGRLFQIMTDKDNLYYQVRDVDSGKLLKEFSAKSSDKRIPFSNTPFVVVDPDLDIIQWKANQTRSEAYFDPKKILREIAKYDVGISVYRIPEAYQISFGAFKEGWRFDAANNNRRDIESEYVYDPALNSLMSYSFTRSSQFTGLFDFETLEHKSGPYREDAISRVSKFIQRNEEVSSLPTIFRIGDYFLLGYYQDLKGVYTLRLFTD